MGRPRGGRAGGCSVGRGGGRGGGRGRGRGGLQGGHEGHEGPSEEPLCDYEKAREDNIRQREAMFRNLQIQDAKKSLDDSNEGREEEEEDIGKATPGKQSRKRKTGKVGDHRSRPLTRQREHEKVAKEVIEVANQLEETESEVDDEPPVQKRKVHMTKRRKREAMRFSAQEKFKRLVEAKKRVEAGAKIRTTAREFDLPEATLRRFDPSKPFKSNRGRVSTVLTEKQEQEVEEGIVTLKNRGYGLTYPQLQGTFQLLFQRLCAADPTKRTGFEATNQRPPIYYCYQFIQRRSSLALRAGMLLTKARAALSLEDCQGWYSNFEAQVLSKPEIAAAMLDPSRVCNAVRNYYRCICF